MTEDEIKVEFERRERIYANLEEEAEFVLRRALRNDNIKTHSIPTRVKDLSSFLDKVKRKDSKDPFGEINDIVGLRVICLFLSDIPRVSDVIRKAFNVLSEDDKVEGSEISSFGYLSFHFIAEMRKDYKGPRYDTVAGVPFEIQVRTILMDAWANVSHYLDYKTDVDVPKALRRDFYALSGLFYVADSHFEMFFKSSKDSSRQMKELATESKPTLILQELNLDSMTAYLRSRLPDRKHSDPKSVSDLVNQLNRAGYKTIQQIDEVLDRTAAAFKATEEKRLARKGGNNFTDVGVVRISVGLIDKQFEGIVLQTVSAEPIS
jgi:putative GTP pyrophosphokinase